ncbi:hypothetical protein EV361DRAFT_911625 [Lentinula raphanica]|nr:hypothetical protein EV361DRAFT_911625 [Lentinula raphanica]
MPLSPPAVTTYPSHGAGASHSCNEGGPGPSVEASAPALAISSTSNVYQVYNENRSSSPFIESEAYARMLLSRKRGYPLWKPKARNAQHPEVYKKHGVHIGDVGLLTQFGGFDYLFNICYGADHEMNLGRVPKDFRPVSDFDANHIVESKYQLGDCVLSDPGRIQQSAVQADYSQGSANQFEGVPKEFGAGRAYSSTTSKGAILILPEGGKRVDYLSPEIFAQHAAEYAASWYTHANAMGRETRNGSLYLITGFDKARAWGTASFRSVNPEDFSLEFVSKPSKGASSYPQYCFRKCQSAVSKSGADDTYGEQSGSVFLRGYRIALRYSWFRKTIPGIINASDLIDPDRSLRVPKHSIRWLLSLSPLDWIKQQFSSGKVVNFYRASNTQACPYLSNHQYETYYFVCTDLSSIRYNQQLAFERYKSRYRYQS